MRTPPTMNLVFFCWPVRSRLAGRCWRQLGLAALLGVLAALTLPAHAQLRFEAEEVSEPDDAWIRDKESPDRWNLWSTDKDANLKWSGGVVLRSPAVMADRERAEEGAPPLQTVLRDLPAGVYTVELKSGRVLGVSLDGTTWQRYSGGTLLSRHQVAAGDSIRFWVDDRFAVENEAGRGAAYYDCVLLYPHRSIEQSIVNPGFEELTKEGTVAQWNWSSRDGGGVEPVTDTIRSGTQAVRIRYDGQADWSLANAARLQVQPGDELCIRAWMRGPVGGEPVSVDVAGYQDGKPISWQLGRGRATMSGEWVQAQGFLRVPDTIDEVQVRLTGRGRTDVIVDEVSLRPEKIVYPPRPQVRGWAETRVQEPMGRAAVAIPRDGGVYLSWRLLAEDPEGIAFDVFRSVGDDTPVKINPQPIVQTTDFFDAAPALQEPRPTYTVRPAAGGTGAVGDAVWAEAGEGAAYVRIRLADEKVLFQKVGIADLNGDGVYDYVIKQPHENIDPWHKYWYKSPETYKIEAYLSDGTRLWSNDLGWAIERGIWYSPYIVCDLTGDGRAEVAAKIGEGDPRDEEGKVTSGAEYVVVWDGMTGREIARAPWPNRDLFDSYNYASRNQIAVAYLDGKTPCLLALRGTYTRMLVQAYLLRDGRLELLWEYDNESYGGMYWGQGAHFTQCADIDGDGRDEVLLGSAVLDDTGVPLWTTGRGHPDAFYLTDVLPGNLGMEIAYVMETRQPAGGGLNVVDVGTGRTLWKLDTPTLHVHGKGMCADIDPTYRGCEVYGADADGHTLTENRWLFAADGTLLRSGTDCPWSFDISTLFWDADLQKEMLRGNTISDYQGGPLTPGIAGRVILKADVLGDWREEIIASVNGELRIYTTSIPAMDRRVCLMQDPVYSQATRMNAMGYTQDPTLSYNPELRSPNLNLTCLIENRAEPVLRVVVSAPADRPISGRVQLATDAGIQLDPAEFTVDVKAGGRIVQMVALTAVDGATPQGWLRARLDGPGVSLQGQVPVRPAAGAEKR
jgi:rhamnogalacturonan endolyase